MMWHLICKAVQDRAPLQQQVSLAVIAAAGMQLVRTASQYSNQSANNTCAGLAAGLLGPTSGTSELGSSADHLEKERQKRRSKETMLHGCPGTASWLVRGPRQLL